MREEINVYKDVEALKELVEIAVLLKESGLLDMLRVIAEKSHELLGLVSNDVGVARLGGIFYSVSSGIESLDVEEIRRARHALERIVKCSLRGAASIGDRKIEPLGVFGLLSALRDKRVQAGLSLLLELARGTGSCILGENSPK